MRVLVLMGGTSAEREVSLASGEAIYEGLRAAGIEAVRGDTALAALPHEGKPPTVTETIGQAPPQAGDLPADNRAWALETLREPALLECDVVFLAFHGGSGENGTVQAVLDVLRVPSTGSGVLASALAMDKGISKMVFEQVGVPTPPWLAVRAASLDAGAIARQVTGTFGLPCVVKPNDQGSTIGLSLVQRAEALSSALTKAAQSTQEILIERYIPGRELTVAILAGEALPVVEIVPHHGVYDYECKYTNGMSEYVVPAQIPQSTERQIAELARKAFRALKCEAYARVDFRLDEEGRLFCLEVNSLPGMTHHSLVPKAAQAAGIEFPDLVARIARLALERAGRLARL